MFNLWTRKKYSFTKTDCEPAGNTNHSTDKLEITIMLYDMYTSAVGCTKFQGKLKDGAIYPSLGAYLRGNIWIELS